MNLPHHFKLVLLFCVSLFAELQAQQPFFLNELSVSVNRTLLLPATHAGIGFGIGGYHAFRADKTVNFCIGFEYNHSSQRHDRISQGRFSHLEDVSFSINNLSVPLFIRTSLGKKVKVFIDAGAFADLPLSARYNGMVHSYAPEGGEMVYHTTHVNEHFRMPALYGPFLGVGMRFPFAGMEAFVKPEVKFALNNAIVGYEELSCHLIRLAIGLNLR